MLHELLRTECVEYCTFIWMTIYTQCIFLFCFSFYTDEKLFIPNLCFITPSNKSWYWSAVVYPNTNHSLLFIYFFICKQYYIFVMKTMLYICKALCFLMMNDEFEQSFLLIKPMFPACYQLSPALNTKRRWFRIFTNLCG